MIRLALSSLAARPLRTALTALAVVLGVAMVSAAFTITDTMRGAADSLSRAAYDGTDAVVGARTAFDVDAGDWTAKRPTVDAGLLDRVRAVPGVAVAAADVTDEAKVIGRDGKPIGDGPYFGVGLDAKTPGADALTPFRLSAGRWAAGPGEVVIDTGMAADEDRPVGSRVTITTLGEPHDFKVVGTANFGSVKSMGTATFAVFDLRRGQGAVRPRRPRRRDPRRRPRRRRPRAAAGGPGAGAPAGERHDGRRAGPLHARRAGAVHLDHPDRAAGVRRRRGARGRVHDLQHALDHRRAADARARAAADGRAPSGARCSAPCSPRRWRSACSRRSWASLAGLGLAKALDAFFDSIGLALPEAGTVFGTRTIVVSLLLGTLVTLIAGLVPAWRATRVPPVAALRAAEPGAGRVRLPARAARALASLLGRPAQAVGGVAGGLARRNAMRQPGRTMATAAALTIGVALVTLVTVVAAGLKDTTRGALEHRLDAAYVVTGADGWSPTDPAVERAAAATGPVTGIRQDRGLAFGDKETVNSLDGDQFRFDWVEGDDGVPATLGDDGAIVDEGWAQEHGLAVGDRFTLTSAKGVELPLTVRGIEGSPLIDATGLGPVTIGKPAYDRAFENDRNLLLLTAADPARALAGLPDAQVRTKAGYVDEQVTSVDQLLAVFYVLLALAVIVSLFGIVNTLVLATFERTRELGTLRAVGMSRRQVRRMVRHESIITALLGAVTGIAAGLALAAVVTSVFGEEGLTFVVPAGSLIGFAVVAVVAGVLAAVLPARRAARTNVLVALAYE